MMDLNNPLEQLPEDLQSWTPEDLAWLKSVPEALQPIARRHQRVLFSLVMQVGGVSVGFAKLGRLLAGNRAGAQALALIGRSYNDLVNGLLKHTGRTLKDFVACKEDIELAMSLANGGKQLQPGERVSAGGIVLDS